MNMAGTMPPGSVSLNGDHVPDSDFAANLATRYLSAAAYLRRAMLPAEIPTLGLASPRPPLPVGRAYAVSVLFGSEGALPMPAVNVVKVRHHCWAALWQTSIRDAAAVGAMLCAAFLEPWGTAIVTGLTGVIIILAGRIRLSSPWVLAAVLGVALALASGGLKERATFAIPLICLGCCFLIYMADIMWSARRVRKLWRTFTPQPSAPPAAALVPAPRAAAGNDGDGYSRFNRRRRQFSVGGDSQVFYDKKGIVGAGTSFSPLALTVPLDKPLDAGRPVGRFTAAQLLAYIGANILTQGAGDGRVHGYAHNPVSADGDGQGLQPPVHFTHGLPYLNVGAVVAVPVPKPRKLPLLPLKVLRLGSRFAGGDIAQLAGRSPSEHPERHYVRASTASWDGQLIATVYLSAALQGHFLRVLIRPYVLAPIVSDLKVADELVERHALLQVAIAAGLTVRQFVAAAKTLRGLPGRPDGARPAKPAKPGLQSIRERYAEPFTDNVHQLEDADRVIRVLEMKIVRVTMDYLRNCNIDVDEYEKQVTNNLVQNTIIGTGNITTGGTFSNSSVTSVNNQGNAGPGNAAPGK